MGRKTAQAVRNRISSVLASLGTQAEGEGDSHFRLVLGLPYTITINIPCDAQVFLHVPLLHLGDRDRRDRRRRPLEQDDQYY